MLANILIPRTGKRSEFTYLISDEEAKYLRRGLLVRLPLRNRLINGLVWSYPVKEKPGINYRPIKKVIHPDLALTDWQINLAKQLSEHFLDPLAESLFLFLPMAKPPTKTSLPAPLKAAKKSFNLSSEQTEAINLIHGSQKPLLLHGVTGSGKTEIYLQMAAESLNQGKQVLILVPEIALTPQTVQRFTERFFEQVVSWHSDLSEAEKRLAWWKVKNKTSNVVVGSRSALFLPFDNLGLIVVDEEHEKSYYQENIPRYDTHWVAEKISELTDAKLIFGSATPSLSSVWKTGSENYRLVSLKNRFNQLRLPETILIDLKQEKLLPKQAISDPLRGYLKETFNQHRQSVLLLNRRGHAQAALCTNCGNISTCSDCNLPLTVHFVGQAGEAKPSLICHHCNHMESLPDACQVCGSIKIDLRGFGTERVEQELKTFLPQARVLRMDRDTTKSRGSFQIMYHDFYQNKYDILLGTQMIAKGWDIPNVDLVGILMAENGLSLPDYRASESTFNLLVQVSGRSGRGENPGKTVMQTFQPEHPLIRFALNHDFGGYARWELQNRRSYRYPPFYRLIRFVYRAKQLELIKIKTSNLTEKLNHLPALIDSEILGPSPCYFERLNGFYRYHMIIKTGKNFELSKLKTIIGNLEKGWTVEIDPVDLL